MDWYDSLEAPIRDVVRALRNAGINTICSCGHEMYIECGSHDPTAECDTVFNVLRELQHEQFDITVSWHVYALGPVQKCLTVWLPRPDGLLANESRAPRGKGELAEKPHRGWGTLFPAVDAATRKLTAPFTIREVMAELALPAYGLRGVLGTTSISSALCRLARMGKLRVVARGGGRRANLYRRIKKEQ